MIRSFQQLLLSVLALLFSNNLIGASPIITPILSAAGPESGIEKPLQIRVSDEKRFNELRSALKKHVKGDNNGVCSSLVESAIDFSNYDLIVVFSGRQCSKGVDFLQIIDENDSINIKIRYRSYQADVEHRGKTSWGMAIIPKSKLTIKIYVEIDQEKGKKPIVEKLCDLPNYRDQKER